MVVTLMVVTLMVVLLNTYAGGLEELLLTFETPYWFAAHCNPFPSLQVGGVEYNHFANEPWSFGIDPPGTE